jgi:hypothetical protein
MTVCDGSGSGSTATRPYEFYASVGNKIYVVNLVMPFGGKENGFYRYPREGEQILVDDNSKIDSDGNPVNATKYYLIGYLPSADNEDNNFLTYTTRNNEDFKFEKEKNSLHKEEGMILRYRQTGKKTPAADPDYGERYSEIGFYKRMAQWPSINSNYTGIPPKRQEGESDGDYSARLVLNGFSKTEDESVAEHIKGATTDQFPDIDHLNIHSTGDIHTTALNHQLLTAKRFEVLVDCPQTAHFVPEDDDLYEPPLGDNVGDDSVLHAGDAHIRAGNRVVIKAEGEIILQAGRSVLKISNDGIELKSKLVNSNLTNAYDATFNMSGREGITMFGRDVNITADKSFGLGDTFGGSVGSSLGVLSLGGREIKAEVYDSVQYAFLTAYAAAQYIQGITSGSMAVKGNVSDSQVGDYIKFAFDTLKGGAELARNIFDVVKEWREFKEYKAQYQEALDLGAIAQGDTAAADADEKKKQLQKTAAEEKARLAEERDNKIADAQTGLDKKDMSQAEFDAIKQEAEAAYTTSADAVDTKLTEQEKTVDAERNAKLANANQAKENQIKAKMNKEVEDVTAAYNQNVAEAQQAKAKGYADVEAKLKAKTITAAEAETERLKFESVFNRSLAKHSRFWNYQKTRITNKAKTELSKIPKPPSP